MTSANRSLPQATSQVFEAMLPETGDSELVPVPTGFGPYCVVHGPGASARSRLRETPPCLTGKAGPGLGTVLPAELYGTVPPGSKWQRLGGGTITNCNGGLANSTPHDGRICPSGIMKLQSQLQS